MQSVLEKLAALPLTEREAILNQLSQSECEALLHDWRGFHARPEQCAPEGDWDIWLILSGRGWGKTRTGAEWIREKALASPIRIALIGETAADARDVMVEGESGILRCHPENERPIYEPSKRRLTWPNGSVATLFNATEPDQLRGPQQHVAWCFIAGTMIETQRGHVPIEQVTDKDWVLTQLGWRRVQCNGSRIAEVGTVRFSTGAVLTGTADHPVLTSHGETTRWTALSELEVGATICAMSAWNGAANAGTDTTAGISNIEAPSALNVLTVTDCTGPFGKPIMGQSRRGMTFTTLTRTAQTTLLKTFSYCRAQITCAITYLSAVCLPQSLNPALQRAPSAALKLSGTPESRQYASVASISKPTSGELLSARVWSVAQPSKQYAEIIAASVVSTWEAAGRAEVFCLQVEEAKHYFANGILVHNCDELAKWRYARETWDQLQFGLRLGDHPQVLVTTTPRPIELVKAIVAGNEGKAVVTRGRTMDNRNNLASTFLEKIENRYGGTRLGRQELEGEILGDIPNALWTLANIDASRVREAPPTMKRIYVAVDPAVSNTEQSDEHGIVVVGQSPDGKEGYVLEDASMKGSPMEWAKRALSVHDRWQADGIAVEVNQGGDMVAQTIRSVRSGVKIVEVRASRGKHVRAEPIAALYEQGRIHHVGSFVELETQMTQMTTFGYEGDGSPDRTDALVWGLSVLFPSMVREEKTKTKAPPPAVVMPMARR